MPKQQPKYQLVHMRRIELGAVYHAGDVVDLSHYEAAQIEDLLAKGVYRVAQPPAPPAPDNEQRGE